MQRWEIFTSSAKWAWQEAVILINENIFFFLLELNLILWSYRIYSINRPGRLLNFWILRVSADSRPSAYKIFTILSKCDMFILQQNNKL